MIVLFALIHRFAVLPAAYLFRGLPFRPPLFFLPLAPIFYRRRASHIIKGKGRKMDFREEIARFTPTANSFSVEFGSRFGYVRGVLKILSFDKNNLVFLVEKRKIVVLRGENLSVSGYVNGDVRIGGIIYGAEIQNL